MMTVEEQKSTVDQIALDEVFLRHPIQSVACEVRFAPKLGLLTKIDEIQEYLASSYAEVGREELTSQNAPTVITYVFSNTAIGRAVKVTEDKFAVVTTNYVSYEEFIGEVTRLIVWIVKSFKINDFTRVGLRYVNSIRVPSVGGKFSLTDYVRPYVNLKAFGAVMPGGFGCEVATRNKDCTLVVRSLFHQQSLEEAVYLLDYDAFMGDKNNGGESTVSVRSIGAVLDVLHHSIQLEFLNHITEHFKEMMRSTQ